MKNISRIIDWHLEKQEPPSSELLGMYENQKELISHCHNQAGFWHGTGKFSYKSFDASRYSEMNSEAQDSFGRIINHGLIPHFDPSNEVWVKEPVLETISVTRNRVYGRTYAQMFQKEGESLDYYYGTRKLWINTFVCGMLVDGLKNVSIQELIKKIKAKKIKDNSQKDLSSKDLNRQRRNWVKAVNQNEKHNKSSLLRLWREVESDISGNFPILIGIKEEKVQETTLVPGVETYESRIPHIINPSQFSHIEVPLCKVEEVRGEIQIILPNLPVIAIELGEIHEQQKSVEEILKPHHMQ